MNIASSVLLKRIPHLFNVSCNVLAADECICTSLVRWRKRRWSPRAPSKIYYVREPTPIDPLEYQELKWRYNNYRHSMKSVRTYFKEERQQKLEEETSKVALKRDADELALLLAMNDQWNAHTAKLREARMAREAAVEEQERLSHLLKLEEDKEHQRDEAMKIIIHDQEMSAHFITLETLDEAIDSALEHVVSYNQALDTDGNHYVEQLDGSLVVETAGGATRRVYEQASGTQVKDHPFPQPLLELEQSQST